VSGTGSLYSARGVGFEIFGARGIGLQALASAAEHEAPSRAEKILTTVVYSPSKSVSCRSGSPPVVCLIFVFSYLLKSKLKIRDEYFGIELVLCDLYITRFDLTKDFHVTLSSLMFSS